jgi:hypothetical protein
MSRLQSEFSVQPSAKQEEAQPEPHQDTPFSEQARPADRPSFSRYIPQQARELSNLISRFSLKRNQAESSGGNGEQTGHKPFALVPYIPPQARGFVAMLNRLRLKFDKKEAAAQTSKFLRYARAESTRIAVKSAQVAAKSAQVAAKSAQVAAKSAQKSAQGLAKAKEELSHTLKPEELKRNYQKMLEVAHNRFVDSKLDPLFFVPTHASGRQANAMSGATPVSAAPSGGQAPQLVFDWALAALPQDLREFVFVDFRAGRGRNLLLATRRNFEKIIGYEFDAQTHDDLVMNVAQFPRSLMVCRNVECLRGDQVEATIPNQPAVLFFSNAQHEELLQPVLELAAASYRENPRSIYVIMFQPGPSLPSGAGEIFAPVPMALIDRLKLGALSPVKVALYRTSA